VNEKPATVPAIESANRSSARPAAATELMMTLRRITLLRDREGHPEVRRELIHHGDAGSESTSIRSPSR
jgi:hypothetical protein